MEQRQRGRGRAHGRARGPDTSGGNGQRPGQPQQPAPAPSGRPGGAWGPPQPSGPSGPQPQAPPPAAWGPRSQVQRLHQVRAPAPQPQEMLAGRATYRRVGDGKAPGGEREISGDVAGAAGDVGVMHGGRGALRGRRTLHESIMRTRPDNLVTKQGTFGKPVKLSANYFRLLQTTDWCLYQYRVDFSPDEDRTPIRKRLVRIALREILPGYIFDGTVLYSARRLNPDPFEVFVDPPSEETTDKIRITFRLVGDVTAGDYHYLQVFNIILRKCMTFLKLQLVGRNFFDAVAKISIPNHKMELWPGYVTSIRQHEDSILLCCEIAHKVMRNDTVLHLLSECSQEDRVQYKNIFQSRIIGSVVLTDYNNRTYTIDDVDWKSSPSSSFQKKDGSSITYLQYFRERYNLNIADRQQPMLVSRTKPREIRAGMPEIVYLVPELCRMTGLTDAQRANFQLMRALADHTRVGPPQRIEKLIRFSKRLRDKPEIMNELRQWDLDLANNLVEFPGRVIDTEVIVGGREMRYSAGPEVDWTRELRAKPFLVEGNCKHWVAICPSRVKTSTENFVQMLQKAAKGMNWNIPPARVVEIRDDRPSTYMDILETVISQQNPSLIFCVASNNKSDRYSAIKKKCCVDRAVPTQVVLAKNLEGKNPMSVATKVAIQMNCKVGGAPWSVLIPVSNMMVVGYDVCHDPREKTKSYGAMVASLDKQLCRYYSCVTAHTRGEEISNDFALSIVKACKAYQERHGRLPERILIYRDGVGDGQIPYVVEHEIEHIKKVLQEKLYPGESLKMCFVIVSKRINTRIFTNGRNPEPGTVVDSCITLPERYDFFIVSQCVRQGTVSPTSYNVVYDNMGLSADHLQRLTYKFTHMYYNWSGTVRVPAPCQYAHKLAFLVAQSLHKTPHPELDTLLYYL